MNDLLNFNFYLLDSENKGIEFIDDKKKMSILNFRIEVLQWTIKKEGHFLDFVEELEKDLNCLKLKIKKRQSNISI